EYPVNHWMDATEKFSSPSKRKLVDAVNGQKMRPIKCGTPAIIPWRSKRRRSREVVNVFGKGIGKHVREPVAKPFFPFQLGRVVIGVSNVVVDSHLAKLWPGLGRLQVRIRPRRYLIERGRAENIGNTVSDVRDRHR